MGNKFLSHLVAVNGNTRQRYAAVRVGSDLSGISVVDAADCKNRSRNRSTGLFISLGDCEIRKPFICDADLNRAAARYALAINVNDHWLAFCVTCRGINLNEGVKPLSYIRNCDPSGGVRRLSADDLTVAENIEHSAGKGSTHVACLCKTKLYLRFVSKNEMHVGIARGN